MRHHNTLRRLFKKLGRQISFVGVELGVYNGELSEALLKTFPNLHLHMADIWSQAAADSLYVQSGDRAAKISGDEHMKNKLEALTRTEPFKERRTIWHCDGKIAAQEMLKLKGKECLDFIFIDAEHTKEAVTADIRAWWALVKRGGIVSGHDYNHRRFHGVKEAVDDFAARNKLELGTGRGSVWWVIKPL